MKYRTIYLRVPEKDWKEITEGAESQGRTITNYMRWVHKEYLNPGKVYCSSCFKNKVGLISDKELKGE